MMVLVTRKLVAHAIVSIQDVIPVIYVALVGVQITSSRDGLTYIRSTICSFLSGYQLSHQCAYLANSKTRITRVSHSYRWQMRWYDLEVGQPCEHDTASNYSHDSEIDARCKD
jgi:hypothetical protein